MTHELDNETPNLYASTAWKSQKNLGTEHVLVFLGSADGFNPHIKRIRTDIWPVVFKCLNLPEYQGNLAENLCLVSLCDIGKPKTFQGYNKLLVRDLLKGYHEGFEVYNAHLKERHVVKTRLLGWVGDLPGTALMCCHTVS